WKGIGARSLRSAAFDSFLGLFEKLGLWGRARFISRSRGTAPKEGDAEEDNEESSGEPMEGTHRAHSSSGPANRKPVEKWTDARFPIAAAISATLSFA